MGARKIYGITIVVALSVVGILWFFLSPTGKEAVEAIDQTASEVTGKRAFDQRQQLRSEVEDISTEHKERLRGIGLDGAPEGR